MILEYLSNMFPDTHCIQEPVAEWTNMKNGTNLLESFYDDRERWSFCFENLVQLSRLKAHYEAFKLVQNQNIHQNKDKKIKIFLERSIYSSFHVFTENSHDDSGLNKAEYDILKEYFKFFTNELNRKSIDERLTKNLNELESNSTKLPFKLIYIRSNPSVCYDRLKTRNRSSEHLIDLKYLENIHKKYEKWVSKINKDNIIIIDGNLNKEKVLEQIDDLFK
jgi:deoxyadenosine/deoxycytidine kinase